MVGFYISEKYMDLDLQMDLLSCIQKFQRTIYVFLAKSDFKS